MSKIARRGHAYIIELRINRGFQILCRLFTRRFSQRFNRGRSDFGIVIAQCRADRCLGVRGPPRLQPTNRRRPDVRVATQQTFFKDRQIAVFLFLTGMVKRPQTQSTIWIVSQF